MKIKELTKEEISAMSYDDLAYMVLLEKGKKMKISDLFKRVCTLMDLSEDIFVNKIADFFELLSTDKKFIMLDDGSWDIREKHSHKIKIDNDDEPVESTEELEDIAELVEDDEEEDEDIFYEGEETDDESENDLKDLVVIEDEEESNGLI